MFKNKNILITGASKGLGREISIEFKKLGANLILVARDKKILDGIVKKDDKKHMIFHCDLFDPKNIITICEYIKKRLKKIDIIVDIMGLTSTNRIALFKNRLAQLQILWLGYNNTSGLSQMDYFIADTNLIKKNEVNLYSEKILFLPSIWNCHSGFELLRKECQNVIVMKY